MKQLPHGYTNATEFVGNRRILKRYIGPHSSERWKTERECLKIFNGVVPVPQIRRVAPGELELGYLSGRHGQELIEEGYGEAVLYSAGQILRRIHQLRVDDFSGIKGAGSVLVHGDFGPHNLLFSKSVDRVTGVLDWEWAHLGNPIEDLAWAEWIVRMHHSNYLSSAIELFKGYGEKPDWADRQRVMLRRCGQIAALKPSEGVTRRWEQEWQKRTAITRSFSLLPNE